MTHFSFTSQELDFLLCETCLNLAVVCSLLVSVCVIGSQSGCRVEHDLPLKWKMSHLVQTYSPEHRVMDVPAADLLFEASILSSTNQTTNRLKSTILTSHHPSDLSFLFPISSQTVSTLFIHIIRINEILFLSYLNFNSLRL